MEGRISYHKIYNLGHKAIEELLLDPVIVEEKIDGSFFSFGVFNGELKARSKGQEIILDCPSEMFVKAIETVKKLAPILHDGWTYRGEYLQKPKHNVLNYNRIPQNHIIIFDINTGNEKYLSYEEKKKEAERIGLEIVPIFFEGKLENIEDLKDLLEKESVLGGPKIEGVVIKNYNRFGRDGKALMGKYVSEKFREVHNKEWRQANPQTGDIIQLLINSFKSEARWQKAVQHLRDNNELEDSPRDIGKLIIEVQKDIKEECEEEIKQILFDYAFPKLKKAVVAGFPVWYKEKLMEKQFE